MEELPSNSNRSREEKPEEKKIERVTTGNVIQRKPTLGSKLKKMFIGGDSGSVVRFILEEILLPAAKDTVTDMVSQGVERLVYGEARSSSRRTGSRPGSGNHNNGYVSYNRVSSPPWKREEQRRPEPSRQSRSRHSFDDIILATRGEANEVIDRMFDLVSRYEQVSVAELYELVGITPQFTDEKWGWTDIRGAGVARVSNGYLLDLPRPEQLD